MCWDSKKENARSTVSTLRWRSPFLLDFEQGTIRMLTVAGSVTFYAGFAVRGAQSEYA